MNNVDVLLTDPKVGDWCRCDRWYYRITSVCPDSFIAGRRRFVRHTDGSYSAAPRYAAYTGIAFVATPEEVDAAARSLGMIPNSPTPNEA